MAREQYCMDISHVYLITRQTATPLHNPVFLVHVVSMGVVNCMKLDKIRHYKKGHSSLGLHS